jgi:hypothetical protein
MTQIETLPIPSDPLVDHVLETAVETSLRSITLFPVYGASVVGHAGLWKDRRRAWRAQGIQITSTWIDAHDLGNEHRLTPLFLAGQWIQNYQDLLHAKAVIVYAEKGDVLRGALVEAGIAMGMHKAVVLVCDHDHPSFGSWQYHPLVHYCKTLDMALHVLRTWSGREPLIKDPAP